MSMKNRNKATAAGGGTAAVLTWAAGYAAQKWNVPIEVAAAAVGTVFAFFGRWAAKLDPTR